jgi:hypothetical protein
MAGDTCFIERQVESVTQRKNPDGLVTGLVVTLTGLDRKYVLGRSCEVQQGDPCVAYEASPAEDNKDQRFHHPVLLGICTECAGTCITSVLGNTVLNAGEADRLAKVIVSDANGARIENPVFENLAHGEHTIRANLGFIDPSPFDCKPI